MGLNLFQLWNRPWRTVIAVTASSHCFEYLVLASQLLIAQAERSAPLRLWPVAQGLPDRHGHRPTIDMRSIGPQKLKITYSFAVAIKPRYNFCQRIVQLGKKDVKHAEVPVSLHSCHRSQRHASGGTRSSEQSSSTQRVNGEP